MERIKLMQYIVIILVVLSCKMDNKNIISLLGSKQNYKPVTSREYVYGSGFCSRSLFLNSDSTFLNESGCEGSSYITIGTWKFMNDSIELDALEGTKLRLILNIESSGKNNNLQTTFIIFDKTGRPVNDFIIFPMKKSDRYTFTSNAGIVLNSNGKSVENCKTNDSGLVNVDISKYDTLVFSQLEKITNRQFRFSTEKLPDTIKIYLDANKAGLQYSDVKYNYWKQSVKFKAHKHKLLNDGISLTELTK